MRCVLSSGEKLEVAGLDPLGSSKHTQWIGSSGRGQWTAATQARRQLSGHTIATVKDATGPILTTGTGSNGQDTQPKWSRHTYRPDSQDTQGPSDLKVRTHWLQWTGHTACVVRTLTGSIARIHIGPSDLRTHKLHGQDTQATWSGHTSFTDRTHSLRG